GEHLSSTFRGEQPDHPIRPGYIPPVATGDVFWCSTCLNMSTRPRLTFDSDGSCSACQWSREKARMDWGPRRRQLDEMLDSIRRDDGGFDCLVPVSGGKDGSYVAYQLKHE